MAYKGMLVDGIFYNVNITKISLSTNFLYKYADRTEDYVFKAELGAIFFNQSLTITHGKSVEDFNKLWDVLSSRSTIDNGTGHNIQIWTPTGRYIFAMYPENFTLEMLEDDGGNGMWTSLQLNFIAIEPSRT